MWRYIGPATAGMCVPQTSIAAGRPGSSRCTSWAAASTYCGWPPEWPLPATSLARFQATTLGWMRASHDVQAHPADRAALLRGGARRPRARRVDRADALPDEDPGGVEAVEQRVAERVLAARGVGADRLQARDDRVHVGRQQRVAAAGRVLLQRGAVQAQRLAVEQQPPAGPAQLAQADARGRGPPRPGPPGAAPSAPGGRAPTGPGPGCARGRARRARRRAPGGRGRSAASCPASAPRTCSVRGPAAVGDAHGDVDDRRRSPAGG